MHAFPHLHPCYNDWFTSSGWLLMISEVEAIDVEKLVKAVRVATSPQAGASGRGTECDSQGDSGLHEHLVIVEGTMLLSMR